MKRKSIGKRILAVLLTLALVNPGMNYAGAVPVYAEEKVSANQVLSGDEIKQNDILKNEAIECEVSVNEVSVNGISVNEVSENEIATGAEKISVTGGELDSDYTDADGVFTIIRDCEMTLSGGTEDMPLADRMVVNPGVTATIHLNGLYLKAAGSYNALLINADSSNKTSLDIVTEEGSTNLFQSEKKDAIFGTDYAAVTLKGKGKLKAVGGDNNIISQSAGAGINCVYTMLIEEGTIEAIGGAGYHGGPGIGLSYNSGTNHNTGLGILISGGAVNAQGGSGIFAGSGIGYVNESLYSNGMGVKVWIDGGTVTATGGTGTTAGAAGIGSCWGTIGISGGDVTATGTGDAHDIGQNRPDVDTKSDTDFGYVRTVDVTLANGREPDETTTKHLVKIDKENKKFIVGGKSCSIYGDVTIPSGYDYKACPLNIRRGIYTVEEGVTFERGGSGTLDLVKGTKAFIYADATNSGYSAWDDSDMTNQIYLKIYQSYVESASLENSRKFVYSGMANEPTCNSIDYITRYKKDVDYTVSYSNNINVDTGKMIITPIEGGRLSGEPVSVPITINPADVVVSIPRQWNIQAGEASLPETEVRGTVAALRSKLAESGTTTWYTDSEHTVEYQESDLTNLSAGESKTLYWLYQQSDPNFIAEKSGSTTVTAAEKAPQLMRFSIQNEFATVDKDTQAISLTANELENASIQVLYWRKYINTIDMAAIVTVNGEPVTDGGNITWSLEQTSSGTVSKQPTITEDGFITIPAYASAADYKIVVRAEETENYAAGVSEISLIVKSVPVTISFTAVAGDAGDGNVSNMDVTGISAANKSYDGQPLSYKGTPVGTKDGTNVPLNEDKTTYTWYYRGAKLNSPPVNAGFYTLVVNCAGTLDGTDYYGKQEIDVSIGYGSYPFRMASKQDILVGSGLEGIIVDADAEYEGVNNETVRGTTTWYRDSTRSALAEDTDLNTLSVDDSVVLYYCFEPDSSNYSSYAGSTRFTAKESVGFNVTITNPQNSNMTRISGKEMQTSITGKIADVVYQSDTGYYFPADYAVTPVNNISVTRNSYTEITVSGKPTGDTTLILKSATEKSAQGAPAVTDGVEKINGTTTKMEYAASNTAVTWTPCTSPSTAVSAGNWYVRYAETDTQKAGATATVIVTAEPATYIITVQDDGYGTATTDKATAKAGEKVTLTATPADGYQFKEWQVISGGVTIAASAFTMPESDVTVKAIFEEISKPPVVTGTIDLAKGNIANMKAMTYTGSELTPLPTVKYDKLKLEEGSDYTVTYENNCNAGNAKVIVTGMGDYYGTLTKEFTINPKALNKSFLEIKDLNATGLPLNPSVVLMDGNKELKLETDYKIVNIKNNTNSGKAQFTLEGIGNYKGTIKGTFMIYEAGVSVLSSCSVVVDETTVPKDGIIYTGKAIKPDVKVTDVSGNEIDKKNYKVSYKKNKNVGIATITIKGKGKRYKGTTIQHFKILPKNIKDSYSILNVKDKTYTGYVVKQSPKVKLLVNQSSGKKTLKAKKEYTISYSNAVNVSDRAIVTVTGTGNYEGSLTMVYAIGKKNISKGIKVAAIKAQKYTGSEIIPELKVTYGKRVLVKGRDYNVTFANNTNKGKATVTLTGIGNNYEGTLNRTFRIK